MALFIITIAFGGLVSALGGLLGYSAARIDWWTAGEPVYVLNSTDPIVFNISYGPIGYNGLLFNIRVEMSLTVRDDAGASIGNGSTVINLISGQQSNLEMQIQLFNLTATNMTSETYIRAVVTLFNYGWCSVDIKSTVNLTDLL